MRAIYPGSFDPITLGHLDIIGRAKQICEELTILISENNSKKTHLPLDVRVQLIQELTSSMDNVSIKTWHGLTADYAKANNFDVIIRGLRGASDFESELEMSQVNSALNGVQTVFLMTSPEYSFIRSSRVWELMKFAGDFTHFVPDNVAQRLVTIQGNHDKIKT